MLFLSERVQHMQVFSFKLRGAYNKMASLSAEQLAGGVICSSAGNHAQGVALAASHLARRSHSRARDQPRCSRSAPGRSASVHAHVL